MPSIGCRQGVFLGQLYGVSLKGRNSARIHLPTHSATEQKSAHPRSNAGHDEREAYAQVILGQSWEYGRLPHEPVHNIRSVVHKVMAHERYYGKKPDLSHTWIFGAIPYVHIPDEKPQKLDPNSEKCILVGYSLEQKGYKCYNPSVGSEETASAEEGSYNVLL